MAINLQKGQKVDLSKDGQSLSKLLIGLGWDPAVPEKKGLFGSMFGKSEANIDCDASVLMLDGNDKVKSKENVIYFGNLHSKCGGVNHSGDNLTGGGDGDDEQIVLDLGKVDPDIKKLVFVVNIYDCVNRKQDFGMIKNAFIRVVNVANKEEMMKYNLTDNYSGKTALITGEIYRYNNGWKFAAIGEGTSDSSLSVIIKKYS